MALHTCTDPRRTLLSPDITSNADQEIAAAGIRVAVILGSALSAIVSLADLQVIETAGPTVQNENSNKGQPVCPLFCPLLPRPKPVVLRSGGIRAGTLQGQGYKSHSFISYLGKRVLLATPAASLEAAPPRGAVSGGREVSQRTEAHSSSSA